MIATATSYFDDVVDLVIRAKAESIEVGTAQVISALGADKFAVVFLQALRTIGADLHGVTERDLAIHAGLRFRPSEFIPL